MLVKTQHLLSLNAYKVSAFVASLLVVFALVSCSDKDDITDNPGAASETEAFVADPTEDQTEVTYSGKTAVPELTFDDLGLAIFSRMGNRTGEITDDVNVVLLSPKALKSDFTVDEAVQLVKLYERGGTVIMVEPRDENWKKLGTLLKKAEEQMTADSTVTYSVHSLVDRWEMLEAQGNEANAFGNQDAVALRFNDTYIIGDLQEQKDSANKAAGQPLTDVTAYSYGKSADLLMKWLKNGTVSQARLAAGKQAAAKAMTRTSASSEATVLSDIMEAQSVTYQKTVGPSRIFRKSMTCEFQYEIYSLYNFEKDEDYYLITQHITYHNNQLGGTPNDSKKFTAIPEDYTFYLDDGTLMKANRTWSPFYSYETTYAAFGPYMSKSVVKSTLSNLGDNETAHLMDPQPSGKIKNETVTSGFSFSLNGIFAIGESGTKGKGPVLFGIIPWVSWSTTNTIEQENLTISREYDNLSAKWILEGLHSSVTNPSAWALSHSTVGDFQCDDWSIDLTWYYRIEHPQKDKVFTLQVVDETSLEELLLFNDLQLATSTSNAHTVKLDAPNRYMQTWVISCSDENLQEEVRNILSQSWRDTYTTYAHNEKGLEEGITVVFNEIKSSIEDIAFLLEDYGYDGHYTFSVSKEGSLTPFKTFTFNHGVVE